MTVFPKYVMILTSVWRDHNRCIVDQYIKPLLLTKKGFNRRLDGGQISQIKEKELEATLGMRKVLFKSRNTRSGFRL